MKKLHTAKFFISAIIGLSSFTLPSVVFAYQKADEAVYQDLNHYNQITEAELAQMLAPIALYPDTLLSHILIASTYPIEVIEAKRWLEKYSHLSKNSLSHKLEKKSWDASVKALTNFPRIINKLNDDLAWMQKLSDAFLQSEEQVLASIQHLRIKADQAGNLSKLDNLNVEKENNIIVISSPSPDIVYVPYYDSRVVYGDWHWRYNQPVYWRTPVHYSYHHGPFYWQRGIRISGSFFFSAFHWLNRQVIIHKSGHHYYDKKYYRKNHFNRKHHAKKSTSYHGTRWYHNKHHRKGARYSNKTISVHHNKRHDKQINTHVGGNFATKKHVNKRVLPHGKAPFRGNKSHVQIKKRLQAPKQHIKVNSYHKNKESIHVKKHNVKAENKNRFKHTDKKGKLSRQDPNGSSNRKVVNRSVKPSSVKYQAKAIKPNRNRGDIKHSKVSRSPKHHKRNYAANNRINDRNR